jgi:tetratricopeptide (TPR) repeat protein
MDSEAQYYFNAAYHKYFHDHDLAGSLIEIDQAVQLDPTNFEYRAFRGERLTQLERYEEAIYDFTYIIEHSQDQDDIGDAIRGRLSAYIDLGDHWHEQIRDVTWEIEHEEVENHSGNYSFRASRYRQLKVWDKAIEDLTTAYQLDPVRGVNLLIRSLMFCFDAQYDNALADLNTLEQGMEDGVIDNYVSPALIYLHRARIFYRLKNESACIENLERYFAGSNDSRTVQEYLEYFKHPEDR